MSAAPAVVYEDVVQGQTGTLQLNVYPGFTNMPVVFYALNMPPNLDMSVTGSMPTAASGSLYYPGYGTLVIKPTANTPPGYYSMTLRATATDGSSYDNWVTVNVKASQAATTADPKTQALADLKRYIGGCRHHADPRAILLRESQLVLPLRIALLVRRPQQRQLDVDLPRK